MKELTPQRKSDSENRRRRNPESGPKMGRKITWQGTSNKCIFWGFFFLGISGGPGGGFGPYIYHHNPYTSLKRPLQSQNLRRSKALPTYHSPLRLQISYPCAARGKKVGKSANSENGKMRKFGQIAENLAAPARIWNEIIMHVRFTMLSVRAQRDRKIVIAKVGSQDECLKRVDTQFYLRRARIHSI